MSLLDIAAIIMVLTGVVHSIAGELMVLRHALKLPGWPVFLGTDFQSRAIVRVMWHLATVFAFAFAAILRHTKDPFIIQTIAVMCAASAVMVLVGTKARHAGWLAFTAMSVLCFLASR